MLDRRRERLTAAALGIGATLLSWFLAASTGAAGIARTDDWSYARVAFTLQRTGSFRLVGWGQMTLVGLAVWAQPWLIALGDHTWALDLSVAVLTAAGLAAGYGLARRVLPVGASVLVVGTLVAFPGVLRDATSFMTDGPALGLQLLTLGTGVASLMASGRRRTVLRLACLALGVGAFSVRELAIAAPLAVLAADAVTGDAPRRRRVALEAVGLLVVCALLWHWRQGLPGGQGYNGRPPLGAGLTLLASAALTVGLATVPVLALTVRRWWRPTWRTARAAGAACGAGVVVSLPLLGRVRHLKNWWLLGDYLQGNGMNGDKLVIGSRPDVVPAALWHLLLAVAMAGAVALVALGLEWTAVTVRARRWATPAVDPVRAVLVGHVVLYGLALTGATVWNGALFDRYLSPLVLPIGVLLLARRPAQAAAHEPRPEVVAGALALAVVAATTLLLTVNSDAFDGARWRAGQAAVAAGYRADSVDAGFEWVGAHATATTPGPAVGGPLDSWWSATFGIRARCAVVAASPVTAPGWREIMTVRWRTYALAGRSVLHVYARTDPTSCP